MHNAHQKSLFGKHVESHSGTFPTLTLYGLACLRVAMVLAIEVCEQTGSSCYFYLFCVCFNSVFKHVDIHRYIHTPGRHMTTKLIRTDYTITIYFINPSGKLNI